MNEANKKTPRTFQCRNTLWRTYEEMAKELECSIDYLINDAMKQYARQRGYAAELPSAVSMPPMSRPASSAPSHPAPAAPAAQQPPGPMLPVQPALAALSPGSTATSRGPGLPPPRPGSSAPPPGVPLPAGAGAPRFAPPSPPGHGTTSGSGSFPHPVPPPPRTSGSGSFPNPAPVPPPPRTSMAGAPAPPQRAGASGRASAALTLHFEGNAYPVNKDRFIIGRGKANSDLTIRDPNISRQHALVEFAAGTYYIVDMGSTNGIEFRGQRVQRKAIQNGDVFRICDHEVFCSMG